MGSQAPEVYGIVPLGAKRQTLFLDSDKPLSTMPRFLGALWVWPETGLVQRRGQARISGTTAFFDCVDQIC